MIRLTWGRIFAAVALSSVAVLFFVVPLLNAQIDRGAIVGTVRDASGAVVPGATVTVTNRATGVSLTTKSNADGAYQVLALLPGTYTATAVAPGFSKQVQSSIVVHVQSRLGVKFVLRVGNVQQQIVVTSSPELLQTQTAEVGRGDRRQAGCGSPLKRPPLFRPGLARAWCPKVLCGR